jgi:hypothetical protein
MPINEDYTFSKIGTKINGVRLRFTVGSFCIDSREYDVVPPHCIVLQHVRTRGWLCGSDWEGENSEDEWKFGEFWEAWVVGKDPIEDTFSVQGDWLADPGWVLEICTNAWLVVCEGEEDGSSLCRSLGMRRGNVESAGTLYSVRVGNGEGEVDKGTDTEIARRIRGNGGKLACLQRAVQFKNPRQDKLEIDTWQCNPIGYPPSHFLPRVRMSPCFSAGTVPYFSATSGTAIPPLTWPNL